MSEETPRRLPPIAVALAAVAAAIFVGGTLVSLLTAGEGEPEESVARPTVEAVMADADLVVEGRAAAVRRLGEPRDAGALALIEIVDVVAPAGFDLEEILIYDKGFREDWREGQRMLLFLRAEQSLPEGAKFRVRERCILDRDALGCPYDREDIERLADES